MKEKFHAVVIGFFRKAMDPTNKLVKDLVAMEACYINTGHPDFLNGHRAMAIVNDRHNANKPTQVDLKTGKPLPPSVPPRSASPSLPTDGSETNSGFFGSFSQARTRIRWRPWNHLPRRSKQVARCQSGRTKKSR